MRTTTTKSRVRSPKAQQTRRLVLVHGAAIYQISGGGCTINMPNVIWKENRAFFGSIPEDFGSRGESTITKLPMRSKQWQSTVSKTKPRRIEWRCFFLFFYEVGAREFYHFVSKAKSRGKIRVAIPRFLLRNIKNAGIRFAVVWSFLWCFCHCLFLIDNFIMVDSPRFPISSGIDPKKPWNIYSWYEVSV